METENAIKTTHNLDFEAAPWEVGKEIKAGFERFRIGTVEGLWTSTANTFDILAITNSEPGNGHLEDVLQWFHHSCVRECKNFRILEVWNQKFKEHLMKFHGFIPETGDNLIRGYQWLQK